MADRRLGCLSIFLFVALCASLFVNFVLVVAAFQRIGGVREAEPMPRFREILLQRGTRGTTDKIAVITMRGLISSSLPGSVTDSMVDDMRTALQQARDDDRVKAIVLEIDSPGGEVTASDQIYNAVVKARARKPVVVYMDSLAASGGEDQGKAHRAEAASRTRQPALTGTGACAKASSVGRGSRQLAGGGVGEQLVQVALCLILVLVQRFV